MRTKLEMPLPLSFIKNALNLYADKGDENKTISAISSDTRELKRGDLFIPLRGEHFDGEKFVKDAVAIGAYSLSSESKGNYIIYTPRTDTALMDIAKAYKAILKVKKCVAITGSVGKTTTKDLTIKLLSKKFKTYGTDKNYNNEIGVPFTVLSAPKDTEILVIEAGMNHKGELARISDCINPDICVITKIGNAHIGNFGSRQGIAEAKMEILHGMTVPLAIVAHEEPLLSSVNGRKTFSVFDKSADFSLLTEDNANDRYTFRYKDNIIKDICIPSPDKHIPECLGFALSACLELGMSCEEIRYAIDELGEISNIKRIQIGNLTIIDDSYNSSPEAVDYAFKTLLAQPGKRHCALLGDMLELGEKAYELHYEIGRLATASGISTLYLFGQYSDNIREGALDCGMDPAHIFVNKDVSDYATTAHQVKNNSREGDVILFKASHKLEIRKIAEILKDKYSC